MKEEKNKFNLKEAWKNPRSKALIQLGLYGAFILIIIIYINITSFINKDYKYNNSINIAENNILNKLEDNNYAYEAAISINNNNEISNYYYNGKVLDTKEIIYKNVNDLETKYYFKDNAYYIYENDNYILTTKDEVYDIINYTYLNIDNISNYIIKGSLFNEDDNTKYYKVKLADIILNYEDEDYITIDVTNNDDIIIDIDYTNIMNKYNENILSYTVKLTFQEIGKITILEDNALQE